MKWRRSKKLGNAKNVGAEAVGEIELNRRVSGLQMTWLLYFFYFKIKA